MQESYHLPLFEGTPPNLGGEFNRLGQQLYYYLSFYVSNGAYAVRNYNLATVEFDFICLLRELPDSMFL